MFDEFEIRSRYESRTKIEMKIVTFLHLYIFEGKAISVHVLIIIAHQNSGLDPDLREESIGIFLKAKTSN